MVTLHPFRRRRVRRTVRLICVYTASSVFLIAAVPAPAAATFEPAGWSWNGE